MIQNGTLYCFEASGSLKLLGSCRIGPVATLSWSLDYNDLVLGTTKGSMLCVKANNLATGPSIISKNSGGELVGVDTVTPGTSHCVVSY